ncbi:sensor histidine kinase [Paenibacillus aquistagni]|uniref:sensor histidine kinase n=1 Tax=Paenibacillus aquistagni TaxID=1852522 RepID=UPI00145B3AA6|nr:histidine kinase [Paenibacillus aquistagni]NMM53703.1 histidine kinase [Paenibacillus aquistagni]
MNNSLHKRLIIGFLAITVPFVILLLYNNLYASNTVRQQVAQSNKNAIMLYANQIQAELNRETNYLYNLAVEDYNIIQLPRITQDEYEYVLTKYRIFNELSRYHHYYSSIDFEFVYSVNNNDLLHTIIPSDSYNEIYKIKTTLIELLQRVNSDSRYFKQWSLIKYGNESALLRLVDTGSGIYLGAFVRLSNLMIPLDLIQLGDDGFASFISQDHEIISSRSAEPSIDKPRFMFQPEEMYQAIELDHKPYIAVTSPIEGTDTMLSAFIPEKSMLQNLIYFRLLIFLIPVCAAIVLIIYLMYLNDLVLKPLRNLINGMRKLKQGDWNVRLHASKTKEFLMINDTFNDMVSQIEELKIHVYEEQIKAHKAEVKHLQLQINPHFLLNSINVIYNLAQIQKNDIIQLMCLNLVKYFRFTTQTHRSVVTIEEELDHMESYIQIQQYRFPHRITYQFDIEDQLRGTGIPPLIIQPFIENCFKYGFDFMDVPFHIHIEINALAEAADQMRIKITDNGAGFPEDVLLQLQSGAYFNSPSGEHLGIWNVYHRFKLIFGYDADITFTNEPRSGACITLQMPIRSVEQFQ